MSELLIKADTANLSDVIGFIDGILEENDCHMKAQMQIDIAVEEMFVNVAHYAYTPDEGDVLITCNVENGSAVITLTDSGTPYDPLKKPDPDITLSAEERQVGGLGIFMVKKSMDSVAYEYKDGKNIFTMTKKIGM